MAAFGEEPPPSWGEAKPASSAAQRDTATQLPQEPTDSRAGLLRSHPASSPHTNHHTR